jgi:2-keto-3-deoxy-L-rhamnonate aldolase RhmA
MPSQPFSNPLRRKLKSGGPTLGLWATLESATVTEVAAELGVETAEAAANIAGILAAPGLEAIFFGPSDLSQSLGHLAVWEGPGVAEAILRMKGLADQRGIASGIIGTSAEDIARRREQGFGMIGLGSDIGLMIRQLRQLLTPFTDLAEHRGGY